MDAARKAERKLGSNTGNRGKGRPKGVPNKVNAAVKDMILQALDKAGGVDYLHKQASINPAAFMTLIGKVLPLQVTGGDEGDKPIQVIRRIVVDPKA